MMFRRLDPYRRGKGMSFIPLAVALSGAACASALPSSALAQEPTVPATPTARTSSGNHAADTLSASEILTRIGKSAGVVAVADSTVARERVTWKIPPSSDTVEHQIDALIKLLPPGTTFAKIYLPEPHPGQVWQGDDVSAYAYAQARLFGKIGSAPPSGFVEILGQRLPQTQAEAQITALHLKPVYLVTNADRQMANGAPADWIPTGADDWQNMTRDQQRLLGKQAADRIMSLSPEQRAQVLQQMKQFDHLLDSVKDPLEHLLGKEL